MPRKVRVWKDPLAECEPHKFSEIFLEGGPEPDSDFTVWVRRMGHSAVRNESMARMRSGEFDPKKFQHLADPETGDINLEDLSTEQFIDLVSQSAWLTPLLVADIQDLPVENDSGEFEVVTSIRETYPNEFDEILGGLLADHHELGQALTIWARQKEEAWQRYVATAKNSSGRTSTTKRGAPQSQRLIPSGTASASTSISDEAPERVS